jgi:hypothetical protein
MSAFNNGNMYTQKKTIRVKKLSIIIGFSILFTIISIGGLAHAQPNPYTPTYCQGKKDEMLTRGGDWMKEWSTARTDPNGQIREKGKQVVSEIESTLANCGDSFSDQDKKSLSSDIDVINTEIEKNIDYGPPCDPACQPGPPIT